MGAERAMRMSRIAGALVAGLLPALLFWFAVTRLVRPGMVVPVGSARSQALHSYEPGFSGERAYAGLSELVSLHPRRYPQTPALKQAAAWARDRFASLGIAA